MCSKTENAISIFAFIGGKNQCIEENNVVDFDGNNSSNHNSFSCSDDKRSITANNLSSASSSSLFFDNPLRVLCKTLFENKNIVNSDKAAVVNLVKKEKLESKKNDLTAGKVEMPVGISFASSHLGFHNHKTANVPLSFLIYSYSGENLFFYHENYDQIFESVPKLLNYRSSCPIISSVYIPPNLVENGMWITGDATGMFGFVYNPFHSNHTSRVVHAHAGAICSLDVDRDKKHSSFISIGTNISSSSSFSFLSASSDGTVRLWSVRTEQGAVTGVRIAGEITTRALLNEMEDGKGCGSESSSNFSIIFNDSEYTPPPDCSVVVPVPQYACFDPFHTGMIIVVISDGHVFHVNMKMLTKCISHTLTPLYMPPVPEQTISVTASLHQTVWRRYGSDFRNEYQAQHYISLNNYYFSSYSSAQLSDSSILPNPDTLTSSSSSVYCSSSSLSLSSSSFSSSSSSSSSIPSRSSSSRSPSEHNVYLNLSRSRNSSKLSPSLSAQMPFSSTLTPQSEPSSRPHIVSVALHGLQEGLLYMGLNRHGLGQALLADYRQKNVLRVYTHPFVEYGRSYASSPPPFDSPSSSSSNTCSTSSSSSSPAPLSPSFYPSTAPAIAPSSLRQLTCVAPHPLNPAVFGTAALDGSYAFWDLRNSKSPVAQYVNMERKTVERSLPSQPVGITSMKFHPVEGSLVALTLTNGEIRLKQTEL